MHRTIQYTEDLNRLYLSIINKRGINYASGELTPIEFFYTNCNRMVKKSKRKTKINPSIEIPKQFKRQYKRLLKVIESGGNLNTFTEKNNNPEYFSEDLTNNEIHFIHLNTSKTPNQVKDFLFSLNPVLITKITNNKVYIIDIKCNTLPEERFTFSIDEAISKLKSIWPEAPGQIDQNKRIKKGKTTARTITIYINQYLNKFHINHMKRMQKNLEKIQIKSIFPLILFEPNSKSHIFFSIKNGKHYAKWIPENKSKYPFRIETNKLSCDIISIKKIKNKKIKKKPPAQLDQIPKKHHFVPKFCIEQFTNSENTIYIYDKETGRINRKPKTPAQVFYKKHFHTVEINNRKFTDIESEYSKIEGEISSFYRLLHEFKQEEKPTEVATSILREKDSVKLIIFLISLLYWRNPSQDKEASREIDKIKKTFNSNKKTNHLGVSEQEIKQLLSDCKNNSEYRKIIRFIFLPLYKFRLNGNLPKDTRIVYTKDHNFEDDIIFSDSPVFISQKAKEHRIRGDFLLPLSRDIILTNIKGKIDFNQIQKIIFDNAQKIVISSSLEHLERTIDRIKKDSIMDIS